MQDGFLERSFHDSLFPRLIYRGEAVPQAWPAGVGDSLLMSAPGLMTPDMTPIRPGQDPDVGDFPYEQWNAQIQTYGKSIDTNMPTSMVAIANLFLRNAQQLGLQAAQTLNRKVRNQMFNAAQSGWTVCDGAQNAVTVLRVKRLNGFTRARNSTGTGTNAVRFETVSASNLLAIRIFESGAEASRNVSAFTPDTPGDEVGPGTITLTVAVTVVDRAYLFSTDKSFIIRVGGGNKVDDLGASDVPTLADVRSAVARLQDQSVPEHTDGRFHCHASPISISKVFNDAELQRLNQSLPDYYMYRQFAIGELLGCVFYRNSESPAQSKVVGGTNPAVFSQQDPFAGELSNNGLTTGLEVHRMLFTAQGGIFEYYSDLSNLLTDAGLTGKVGEPTITNNGIEVFSERIQMIIRSPLNRFQDMVATSWRIIADWPARTDATTGDSSRFKRFVSVEHC